ncbi:TIGR00341 family protein [Methanosarcina sp. KYL-1]|uniref:TIGR00341 family protein n=1 Tax=Methanosarcina sp. KYL-1 TaxID=2602068 RepID=UPI002101B196|nr:TIGR00341 family protein [Methanosarcina sp. KYL-1]MCQ1535703.1 TIGR00341 family protein [Methanosarcina sp. KYL-1]
MRIVQVLIPEGKREPVLAVLDDEQIDYAVWDETGRGDFEALVQFPIPPIGVEPVMARLREAGISKNAYTIVLSPETVVSSRLEALKKRYSGLRISREELIARAEDLAPATSTFVAFLVLSTIIATGGLLLDSAATIIGAMVVAPLMGPAISASVGTVIDERKLAARGVRLQVGGLLLAILVAAAIGAIMKGTLLLPPGLDIREIGQIAERTSPNFLSLFLALGSGLAGAISIMRGSGSTLVGVAIAVALVPPAATSGLGLAWGLYGVALTAAVLVLVNLLAINVSALILFWISGFRPPGEEAVGRARAAVISRTAVLAILIAFLSVVLALVTYTSFQAALVEQQVDQELWDMFEEPRYVEAGIGRGKDVRVDYTPSDFLLGEPVRVTFIVGYQAGEEIPPDIAEVAGERLKKATGKDVEVTAGFVVAQQVAT